MKHVPKLTPRQRTFLDKLLELYREHKSPIHYSTVAARLGVNRFSAYDMLKVLEKKGLASSSYALTTGHSGPGRSLVVFAPTPQAASLLYPDLEFLRPDQDWHGLRERVLSKLGQAGEANPRDVLEDLLARIPDSKAPLAFCTQMIGILLLNMRRATARAEEINPFRALATLRSNDVAGLEALAGLSVGATLSADDEASSSLTLRLMDLAHSYQVNLGRLGEEARVALALFLEEALQALD